MKKLFILALFVILLGCEKVTQPPDDIEFTDIRYEVRGDFLDDGILKVNITYGDLKNCNPDYPNSYLLCWDTVMHRLPWTYTQTTRVGHPVRLSVISSGNRGASIIVRIIDGNHLVATQTYVSNGLIWGGIIEYNIPNP